MSMIDVMSVVHYSKGMKQRAFTLVEVLIVVVIVSILAGLATTAYIAYQNRAADSHAKALAGQVMSSSERYYNKNFDYPQLGSISSNGVPSATHYSSMASTLDVPSYSLSDQKFKLFACASACTIPNATADFVYYLTKSAASGTSAAYTVSTCTYTFASADSPGEAYVVAYQKKEDSSWVVQQSANGSVTKTGTCP